MSNDKQPVLSAEEAANNYIKTLHPSDFTGTEATAFIAGAEWQAAQLQSAPDEDTLYKWVNYPDNKPDKEGLYIVDRRGEILKIVFSETENSPINEMWEGVRKWLKPIEYAAQSAPKQSAGVKSFSNWIESKQNDLDKAGDGYEALSDLSKKCIDYAVERYIKQLLKNGK